MRRVTNQSEVSANCVGVPQCIWSTGGYISNRTCSRTLNCDRCQFDQEMVDYFACGLVQIPPRPLQRPM